MAMSFCNIGELTYYGSVDSVPSNQIGFGFITGSQDNKYVYVFNSNSSCISVFERNISNGSLTFIENSTLLGNESKIYISQDSKNVYAVLGQTTFPIIIFNRDLITGELTQSGSYSPGTSDYYFQDIVISKDDKNIYLVSEGVNGGIYTLNRNLTNGQLSLNDFISNNQLDGDLADDVKKITISNDGKNVYTANRNRSTVSIYSRNLITGNLTLLSVFDYGGLLNYPTDICVSNDDKNVFVAPSGSSVILNFGRDVSNGSFNSIQAISVTGSQPWYLSLSSDDKTLYVSYNYNSSQITAYDRNLINGNLTFLQDANIDPITNTRSRGVFSSLDSKNVYFSPSVIPYGSLSLSIFSRCTGSENSTALMIDVQPYGVVSGDPFTTQPIIKIVDSNGDLVPTATNDVEAAITVVNGSGSLTGTTTVTAVDGYATFTDLVFTGAGSFYLTFTSTGLTEIDSDEIATLTPTELVVYVQPIAGLSGELLFTQPTITIANWLGDLVPDATDVVDVSLVDVTGSSVLTGTLNSTASGGYAAFTDLIATGYGSFYLTFTSGTLTSVNSDTLFFTPDPGNPNPPIPVKPKRSYTPLSVPTSGDMETNEFAINVADKKGYVRDSNGIIHLVFDGNASGSGSVTSVGLSSTNSTLTISDSPVTTSGTIKIDLPETGVSAKAYTNADITIDVYGRITAASDGAGVTSIIAGTGVSVDTATGDVTVTNSLPDQTVSLTNGTAISVTGTYPDFTITNDSPDQIVTLTDGTAISVTGTYPDFTITNSLPDQTVTLTEGTDITITGTYPDFTIGYSGVAGGVTSIIAGTGISVDVATGDVTVTNSAPDQIVSITSGTGINTTGIYPDFTIDSTITQYTDSDARLALSAGTGISYDNATGIITNSEPDQTVSLTDGTGISVTGTYPSFTIATTITQYTDSDARLSLSAGTGISYDNATGIITNSAPDQTVSLTDGTDISVTGTYPNFTISYTGSSGSGTVTSVDMSVPVGLLVSGNPITTTGTLSVTFDTGYSIPTTTSQTNWDTAYSNYLQWDGGSTSLVAATGRTSLGASTVGENLFTLTNPSAITFPRFNADNTVTALNDADFRTAIGAGTSSTTGTVTSISTTSPITGGTITGTGTIGINAASANTASYVVQRDASGNFSAGTITASLTGTASTATNLAGGGAGQVPYQSASGTTAMLSAGTSGQVLTSSGTSAPTWSNVMPSGTIMQYAGATAPTGYLICDGSAVSRTTYATLFAVTSTTYGVGNGSTTFNLPNLQSRLPIGAGTGSGLTLRTRGTTYGTETFTLASGNIPQLTSGNMSANASHSHTQLRPSYVYVGSGGGAGNAAGTIIQTSDNVSGPQIQSQSTEHTHSVGNITPSAVTFLPPSLALNYIIKT
jgi:microcystin-dependent protein/6-phosphogluconolactonase (cycloisomerase 2 family)